jgi:hypothetical protein
MDYIRHVIVIRYCGWGEQCDEEVPFGSERLLPFKAVSLDNVSILFCFVLLKYRYKS